MSKYLLNGLYLLLLALTLPWFFYQRLFRGKYREGFAAKFWGAVAILAVPLLFSLFAMYRAIVPPPHR